MGVAVIPPSRRVADHRRSGTRCRVRRGASPLTHTGGGRIPAVLEDRATEVRMDVRFVWTAAKSELGAGRSLVSSHPTEDLPELLARTDGLVWVDIPTWDDEAFTGAVRGLLLPSAGHQGLHGAQSRAQGARVPGLRLPGAARPGRRQGRARALHRAGPVRRAELPGHRARAAQSGGRPGRGQGRGDLAAAPTAGRQAAAQGALRAVARDGVRADRPAAQLHGRR